MDGQHRRADGVDEGSGCQDAGGVVVTVDDEREGARVVVDGHLNAGDGDDEGGARGVGAHVLDGQEPINNGAIDLS